MRSAHKARRSRIPLMLTSCVPALLAFAAIASAQVVPSGQTATTVGTAASGKQTINIAPTVSGGLSYNSYNSFSVGKPGASLDNRVVGARTIANEVITANRSVIQGPIDVLGSRAHVILANPNGITIDGGSFVNTGGVVLGTGTLERVSRVLAPHVTQTDAILHTNGTGDIFVGGGGLAGTMTQLQLYAGRIKVDGPIAYKQEDQSAPKAGTISLLAGKSDVSFNSAILPIAALDTWASVTQKGTGSSAVLVDVTTQGALSASRVYVGVSEKGAGVAYAGQGLASAAEFNITSTGQVTFTGAQITAAADLKVKGAGITVLNNPATQSQLKSVQGALTMLATDGDLANLGGLLQGAVRNAKDSDSKGGVTLKAAGNITQASSVPGLLAVAFASDDDLSVTAGGAITNTNGRLLSNAQTRITAGGTFTNGITLADVPSNAGQIETFQAASPWHWYQFWRPLHRHGFSVGYGTLSIAGQLAYVVGNGVSITATRVLNRGGEIDANDGNVEIRTGSLLNEGIVTGSASYGEKCQFFCRMTGFSDIAVNGGRINASQRIDIAATGDVVNKGGQWLGIDGVSIKASRIALQGVMLVDIVTRPGGLGTLFSGRVGFAKFDDAGGAVVSSNGDVSITTETPVVVDRGLLSAAGSVRTPAGIITVSEPQHTTSAGGRDLGVLWNATREQMWVR